MPTETDLLPTPLGEALAQVTLDGKTLSPAGRVLLAAIEAEMATATETNARLWNALLALIHDTPDTPPVATTITGAADAA